MTLQSIHLNVVCQKTVEEMDIRSTQMSQILVFLDGRRLHRKELQTYNW